MKVLIYTTFFLFIVTKAFGQPNKTDIDDFNKQVKEVSTRLFSVVEDIPKDLEWPPKIEIVEEKQLNAYASVINKHPKIVVHTSILAVTEGNPDRLAYILSHELAHILNNHCNPSNLKGTEAFKFMFTRENEVEADIEGLRISLKAGYSYKEAINTFKAMREKFGDYSPLEALSVDHPSWTQRLALIDSVQTRLWKSMSAFNNGVYFLFTQNYEAAIVCFKKVVDEFPLCYEGYLNIGYSYLMQYFDLLDKEDIKYFNVGEIAIGGFYRRPESMETQIRGPNEDLWWNAIAYLKHALMIKPDLSLAKSHLGVAYFLDPRQTSLGESERILTEALRSVRNDSTLDESLKASVYVNASAIDIAIDNYNQAQTKMDSARIFQKEFKKKNPENAFRSPVTGYIGNTTVIDYALELNQIINDFKRFDGQVNQGQIKTLLRYLRNTDPASVWWQIAYDYYEDFSVKIGTKYFSKEQILNEIIPETQPVNSVVLDSFTVYLSQNISEVLSKLDSFKQVPVVEGRKIIKYIFPETNMEIISGNEILGIIIKGNNPEIKLGLKSNLFDNINVGVTFEQVRNQLNNYDFEYLPIPGEEEKYIYYTELGIGFKIEKSVVCEMLIFKKPTEYRHI